MSQLSDYKRIVEAPMIAGYEAGIEARDREIAALRKIIQNTLWMACRYAHGRQSYAVGKYNEAARLGFEIGAVDKGRSPEPIFALDGSMTAEMSGLSPDEFAEAYRGWSKPTSVPNHARNALKGASS